MKSPQILYTSPEIHSRIKKLFANPNANDKRVALVAYIGKQAESYLPHPKGLRVICNPSAGGTHPDALRNLIMRGAKVEFSDGLHMKVYWSRQRGCVLTSANASANALGVSGLKEAGVWLPPGMLDINRLLNYARPRKVTPGGLRKLDVQTRRFAKNHGKNYFARPPAQQFLGWYKSPHRTFWKLNWCLEKVDKTAKAAKAESLTEYGRKEPYGWVTVGKNRVKPNDWLLSFILADKKQKVTAVEWRYVDFLIKISPKERLFYERYWPCHAVQVYPPSKYPTPPFELSPRFRVAFNRAALRYSFERIQNAKSDAPSPNLLRLIAEEMRK